MSSQPYLPAVDGLRAYAVIVVLIFHLVPKSLPGGFTGVDVFFVISGYLITGLIFRAMTEREFSLREFYHRRVARIFPQLTLMIAVTLGTAWWVYPDEDVASIGSAGVAAILGLSNMKFMLQGSYFQIVPDTQPLLHTWSLGVEEQFYLFWPVVLFVLYRRSRSIARLLLAISLVGLLSFIGFVVVNQYREVYAFYFMPLRAWELLLGAWVAVAGSRVGEWKHFRRSAPWLVWGGAGSMVMASLSIRSQASGGGFAIVLPVAGAALFVLAHGAASKSLPVRILSHPTLVSLGRWSYALYLWHWPVYCWVDYSFFESHWGYRTLLKLIGTVVLTGLSYALVERPLRVYINRLKRSTVVFVTVAMLAAILCYVGLYQRRHGHLTAGLTSLSSGGIQVGSAEGRPVVVLYGDSVAATYGAAAARWADGRGARLHVMAVDGQNPLVDGPMWEQAQGWLSKMHPDCIVVAMAWTNLRKPDEEVDRLIGALSRQCGTVLILTQTPLLPSSASRLRIQDEGSGSREEDPKWTEHRTQMLQRFRRLASDRVMILDIAPLMMDADGQIALRDSSGNQNYQDYLHPSGHGAARGWGELQPMLHSLPRRDASLDPSREEQSPTR
jgi:peptidoglycan/LPS O-acetylase OafA/YrhL